MDVDQIKQIPLINKNNTDELMWMHEKNGIYTVKSGYKAIQGWKARTNTSPSSSSPETKVWKKLWSLHTIPRHKTILWRILNNSLPLTAELNKKGIICSPICPRCQTKIETMDHVFLTCPYSVKVWFGSSLNINFEKQQTINFQDWLYDTILNKDEEVTIQTVAIIYNIWFARNLKFYEDRLIPEEDIILHAAKSVTYFKHATIITRIPYISDQFKIALLTDLDPQ